MLNEDLLTTGEAAALLGTTSRHVVDLCNRGELPYTMTGTHRRIRRREVEAFAQRRSLSKGGPMTRDQLRSLWLGRLTAARIALDPEGTLERARDTAVRFLSNDPSGARWLQQWILIIDRGPEEVMRTLTSNSPMARELRQNSPFVGIVSERDRQRLIKSFSRTTKR